MTLRTVVVDDEPLARQTIVDLLRADPETEVVGEAGDGSAALDLVRELRPDILFLDVEMPEKSGLEVAGELAAREQERLPAIVFVTAYDQFALRAFDLEALDYVLKPFADDRFRAALERAKRRVREQRLSELAEKVAAVSRELTGSGSGATGTVDPAGPESDGVGGRESRPEHLDRLPVKVGDRSRIVRVEEIDWIESDDYYARLHTAGGSHLVRVSLAWLEERLDPSRFVRVHRKAIVRLDAVSEVHQLFKSARAVLLRDGTRIRISRSRLKDVERKLLPKLGVR